MKKGKLVLKTNIRKLVLVLVLVLFVSLCTFVTINTFKKSKIDKVLETSSYSYLPKEAKNFIKEVYEKTGEVVLTEKNKKSNAPYLNTQYIAYLELSEEERQEAYDTLLAMLPEAMESDDFTELIPEESLTLEAGTIEFMEGDELFGATFEKEALKLQNGQVADYIVEEEDGYYIIKMVNDNSMESYNDEVAAMQERLIYEEFQKVYREADVIIAKGQANYESLSEENKNIYFLLMTKCKVIADDIGVKEKSLVCMKNKNS